MRIRVLPEGQKRTLTPIWHIAAATSGVAVFLVVNLLLLIDRCPSSGSGFGWNCSSGAPHYLDVLFIAGGLGLMSVLSRRARTFAIGFAGGLLAMAVITTGACTPSWADPVKAARMKMERRLEARAREREKVDTRTRWIAAMNQQTLDVPRGVYLAGNVLSCAQGFAASHGGVAPSHEGQFSEHCANLREYSASYDLDPPRRYKVPTNGERRAMQHPIERVEGDPGWRVQYEVAGDGRMVVRVAPDSQLAHKGPVIHADSSGMLELQLTDSGPRFAVSPVEDLRTMVECLKGVPEEVERRKEQRGGVSYGWYLTSMTARLCPRLEPRLRALVPNDENSTLLTLLAPVGSGGAAIPVAAYKVDFIIRQPANEPFAFDLSASATTWGLPHYRATFEGAVERVARVEGQ